MDRYCISNYSASKFHLTEDKEIYLDVNFKHIINDVMKSVTEPETLSRRSSSYIFQGIMNMYEFYQEDKWGDNFEQIKGQHYELEQIITKTVPLSFEYELDLIDETLLCIMQKENKKEKLFLDKAEELNNDMKNTIHNRNKVNYIFPFNPEWIQSESKKAEIPALGSGVMRLWLSSSEFRKLLVENTSRFEKYETQNLFHILDSGVEKGLKYSTEDTIILEKILGISTGNAFESYIMSLLEKETIWKELLDILLEYEGEYSRCAIIQAIGFDLYNWKNKIRKASNKKIETYVKLLEYYVKPYNNIYRSSVETITSIYFSFKDLSAIREHLIGRRKELLKFGCPAFSSNVIYYEKIIKPKYSRFLEELMQVELESEKVELIQKRTEDIYKIMPFYTECQDVEKKMLKLDYLEETDRLKRIREKIIQINRKKYNF